MIAVDCEGAACVVGEPGMSLSNSCNMTFAKEQVTRETNAAVRALFDSGAKEVVVWDSHGDGVNLIYDQLDQRCEIVLGSGFERRFPQLDESFTGVLMIGYHAMAGTANAVLAHTYSSSAYYYIKVNGENVGEIALDAAVAGELGVPLIFVASDDKGCAEAVEFVPWVEKVATKTGLGRNCARSKHPTLVENQIYAAVIRAVKHLDEKPPFAFKQPLQLEVQYKSIGQLIKARIRRRGWHATGARTLKGRLASMLDLKL